MSNFARVLIPAKKIGNLEEAEAIIDDFDVVAIDEGQFFPDVSDSNFIHKLIDQLVEKADNWANRGLTVIIACLDATFQRKVNFYTINMNSDFFVAIRKCLQFAFYG